jgi:hypothetical protein
MKNINVTIKKIKVNHFFPKEGYVELSIAFNDGQEKEFLKTTKVDEPELLSLNLLDEIRKIVKNTYQKFNGEKVLENIVTVRINKREEITKKLTDFFKKLKDKVSRVKKAKVAEGYINLFHDVTGTGIEL